MERGIYLKNIEGATKEITRLFDSFGSYDNEDVYVKVNSDTYTELLMFYNKQVQDVLFDANRCTNFSVVSLLIAGRKMEELTSKVEEIHHLFIQSKNE